jgi:hypothetical protein
MLQVIVLYPVLLICAVALALSRRDSPTGYGWAWFGAWTAAGALFIFSLFAGFSIGLLLLPTAAVLLIWTSVKAPHGPEALGFLLGTGLVILLVATLQGWKGWYVAGMIACLTGLFGYAEALTRRDARTPRLR